MPENIEEEESTGRTVPLWLKFFVPLHLLAITSWSMPNAPRQFQGDHPQTPLRVRTNSVPIFLKTSAEYVENHLLLANSKYIKESPLELYLLTTGFWQYWDMFSPNPASIDEYCDAVVYYKDGTKKLYHYPRIYDLSLGQKFIKERWRKYFERAGDPGFRYLWPVFGQRVALMNYDDADNPPVKVDLHKHEFEIMPPDKPQNTAYTDELYYTYVVDQAALRRDKR